MKAILRGKSIVICTHPEGDKVAEASILEPLFEAGFVKMLIAPWNRAAIAEINAFPRGKHDDQVDAIKIGARALVNRGGTRCGFST